MSTSTRGASADALHALLDAARRPSDERRIAVHLALQGLADVHGVVGAVYLDAHDDQDDACLADLAPSPGPTAERRFVRSRHDLTPASARRLAMPSASAVLGFADTAFGRRWGAMVVGLDDTGVRHVSHFDHLQPIGSVAGWVTRSIDTHRETSDPDDTRTRGAIVDLVEHAVVFHPTPGGAPLVNERAERFREHWLHDAGEPIDAWDTSRFLRAHDATDGRTRPEIVRIDDEPHWWRRTTVLRAEGGAILGMLSEIGGFARNLRGVPADDPAGSVAAVDRAWATLDALHPPLDTDERAVVGQVLLGRRMSTVARELHMGERRARDLLRGVLTRVDRRVQAELAIVVRRSAAPE